MYSLRESSLFHQPVAAASAGDFDRAARLLYSRAGILLGEHKREMVERRLGLRARELGFGRVCAYLDLLERDAGSPHWEGFINGFTINHTAFFREYHHFPALARHARLCRRPLSVWCASCSTGEEAYSIAMTLNAECGMTETAVRITATDIDTHAINHARQGVYAIERLSTLPDGYLPRYFQRGAGRQAGMARIKPALRNMIDFGVVNLLSSQWPEGPFDAIFCRNTMIYFDRPTQTRLLDRFARALKRDGLLFAGHSENFTYLTEAFRLRGQTVYAVA